MTRRGQKKHLKRLPAPRYWPIKRKTGKFTTRVIPGPHAREHCLTLALVLREVLGYAENMREAKAILSSGQIKVDGHIRKDPRFPVGLMDVIHITTSGERFRLLPKKRGGFLLISIDDKEAEFKLCKIETKTMVKGGKVQLGLHDGRTLLLSESEKPSKYNTLDTLKISIPDQKILSSIHSRTEFMLWSLEVETLEMRGKSLRLKSVWALMLAQLHWKILKENDSRQPEIMCLL
jgi:small subunit ribosomal protein S4e